MSNIWAIVIGVAFGILVAPMCALLIIAWLRGRDGNDNFFPWPDDIRVRPMLPELSEQPATLALPGTQDLQ